MVHVLDGAGSSEGGHLSSHQLVSTPEDLWVHVKVFSVVRKGLGVYILGRVDP